MASSKSRWHCPLEDQPELVSRAIAGDHEAQKGVLACYGYLIGRLSSAEESKTDREDLRSELTVCVLEDVLPALTRIGFRGYPAYVKVCLLNARNAFWRKYHPKRRLTDIDITEIAASEEEAIDPRTAHQLIWEALEAHPEIIWRSKLRCAGWLPHFARKLGIPTHELRRQVALTMVRAHATLKKMQKTFGVSGRFWLMDLQELSKLRSLATVRQKEALELFLSGYSTDEMVKEHLPDGPNLLRRLYRAWEKGQRPLTVLEYFQRLDRDRLILAIQLAAPIQLRILQECLRGKNTAEIKTVVGYQHHSMVWASLKALRKRLEKELAQRSQLTGQRRT